MHHLRGFVLAGAVAGAAVPSLAWSAEPQWGPSNDRPAYDEGYERGLRAGTDDYRRGDRFEFSDESDYRRGDLGYRYEYGDRDRYRGMFRRGFESGYRSGYGEYRNTGRGVPSWGAGPGRFDRGFDTGVNDGYEAGLNDARRAHRYDPVSEGRYRSADRGYERWYGPKDAYRNSYRTGFRQGYERGYQDGRRYGNNRLRLGGFLGFLF